MSASQIDRSEIPIVDFQRYKGAAADRYAIAYDLQKFCHEVGFFVIINHGVDQSTTEAAFNYSKQFFSFPQQTKTAYR